MADRWEERNRSDYRDNDFGYRDRERHERGITERAGDEVRSWLGDDEAARRRRMDELREGRHDRDWNARTPDTAERALGRTRDAVRDWTDRDRDGRRGLAEWNDDDRVRIERSSAPMTGYGTAYSPSRDWSGTRQSTGTSQWTGTNYAGRGPRGYQRGDERIREDVCDRLTDDPRIDASDIEIQVNGGEVTLGGSVRSRDEKRFTEDLVERVSGVRDVNNHLKVRPADEVLGTARSGASVLGLSDTPPPTARNTK
jgi:osmotically-inducible protein OsmY